MAKPKQQNIDQLLNAEMMVKRQCSLCPLVKYKKADIPVQPSPILVITNKNQFPIRELLGRNVAHSYAVECLPMQSESAKEAEKLCCLGRKLDLISQLKPKLVVVAGYDNYKQLELQCGNDPDGPEDFQLLPTQYRGHNFWLLPVPDYDTKGALTARSALIETALTTEPVPEKGRLDGIEFITSNDQIDAAFDWLEQQEYVAADTETNKLRPYHKTSKLLSIAIGTYERTFAFPLFHSQTPGDFDVARVLERLFRLPTFTKLIFHNGTFDLEWLSHALGEDFLYQGEYHDTIGQAYVLQHVDLGKSLDLCVRRLLGFSLKAISKLDVTRLDEIALEKVLRYNALDVKYTQRLFFMQQALLELQGLVSVYQDLQRERIAPIVLSQLRGLLTDQRFIQDETTAVQNELNHELALFHQIPEILQYNYKFVDKFNWASGDDVKKVIGHLLPVDELTGKQSTDEEALSEVDHPIADGVVRLRKLDKMLSTYLIPMNKGIAGGGKYIYDDGLIHTIFNVSKTLTARLSSEEPNVQNIPKRGGKERIRNAITVPIGHTFVALDYAQIEYRFIGTMSQDKEILASLWDDNLDVHMFWARKIAAAYPQMVANPDDKDQMKEFRSAVKNQWTFPLCYGAKLKKVSSLLRISNTRRLDKLIDEFWQHHEGVRKWQEQMVKDFKTKGYVENVFGRRFREPLTYNSMINAPVQSSAFETVMRAHAKLARMDIVKKLKHICPRISLHDDLSFFIPDELVAEYLPIIITTMLDVSEYERTEANPEGWLTVPLGVEVSIGTSWGELKKVGTYFSHTWQPVTIAA